MARHILFKVLRRKKLSKRQFAKLIGIQYHNVFRLFHDGYDPKLSVLSKWAHALKCKVRDLIEE